VSAVSFALGLPCLERFPAFFPYSCKVRLPGGAGRRIVITGRRGITSAADVEKQAGDGTQVI
jgi:hypothetical protein